jgi:hypothetical protein
MLGEVGVLRVDPRGWVYKRGRQVEIICGFFFLLFGYVRPVLARTVPTDLVLFSDPRGELTSNVDDDDEIDCWCVEHCDFPKLMLFIFNSHLKKLSPMGEKLSQLMEINF